jgi:hypothetical protein
LEIQHPKVNPQRPKSPSAEGEILNTPFFWFFFCGYLLKKRTEKIISM